MENSRKACKVKSEKRKVKKKILTLMVITFIAAFIGCAKKEAPRTQGYGQKLEEPAEESSEPNIQQKILAFNLEGLSEKGQKKWEVKGESAEAVSQAEIRLNNIVAKSYGDGTEATLTADKGIYDKSKNNVKLEENVKAVIENTEALAKEHMDLPGQLVGPAPSKVAGQGSGEKMRTMIVCDEEAVFDYEKNLAYFNKNVKVRSTDGDIDADRITVNLDMTTKKIRDIVAEGNVKIRKGENTTYSDKAVYSEIEKKVTLFGNPKLVIYQEGGVEENFLRK